MSIWIVGSVARQWVNKFLASGSLMNEVVWVRVSSMVDE